MDYHCRKTPKRLCGPCRRDKKYRRLDFDLFKSVEQAAYNLRIKTRHRIAVRMESEVGVDGTVNHRYWNYWSDGTTSLMTKDEVIAWSNEGAEWPQWIQWTDSDPGADPTAPSDMSVSDVTGL